MPKGYQRPTEEHDQLLERRRNLDIFEDDERNVWAGYVTRNKAHRVLMEAYVVGDLN